jgi:nucleotide-binding universal stress UspA family protein
MFHKILVAVDEPNSGKNVFRYALDLAKAMSSSMLLMNVLNPGDKDYPDVAIYPAFYGYYPVSDEVFKQWQERLLEYKQHRQEMLQALASEAEGLGVTTELSLDVGDPGRTICAVACTWGADLIIVGRRGRSGVNELLLGSVSNYVMHHAPCSVLTVQGKAQTELESAPKEVVVTH